MKTRLLCGFGLAVAFSLLPFISGCNQSGGEPKSSTNAVVQETVTFSQPDFDVGPPLAAETAVVPVPPVEKTLPVDIKPSPPLAEIIRLANAGVEEGVLLSYVNNSQSAFNLGPDEIIYLTDIGVPDAVVTAMIAHDQALKQPSAPPAQPVAAEVVSAPPQPEEENSVAAAPTYDNPPEAQVVEEPQQVVSDSYFYENLAPYGSWVQVNGYGWCWQPTAVVLNRSWRPYCDRGRWLYTDCGWYWQSDYSWGMTFHYGRWFNQPDYGWCWAPDRTWGPAWVTWRYNDDYCGWAPLPPGTYYQSAIGLTYVSGSVAVNYGFGLSSDCYTFVSWRGFCDRRPHRHCLPSAQVATVFNNTTVVNNVASGDHNRVVNRGIAPDHVAQHSGRPIQKTTVRDAQARHETREFAENRGRTQEGFIARRASGADREPISGAKNRIGSRNRTHDEEFALATPGTIPSSQPDLGTPMPINGRTDARSRDFRDNQTPRLGLSNNRDRRGEEKIVHSSESADQPVETSPAQKAPPGSLIIIGKRDNDQSRATGRFTPPSTRNSSAYYQVQTPAPEVEVQQPVAFVPQTQTAPPNVTRSWPLPAQAQPQRQDNTALNNRGENRFQNRPSGPAVANRQSVPSYTLPAPQPLPPQRFDPTPAVQPPVNVAPPVQKVEPRSGSGASQRVESPSRSSDSAGSNRGGSSRPDRQR